MSKNNWQHLSDDDIHPPSGRTMGAKRRAFTKYNAKRNMTNYNREYSQDPANWDRAKDLHLQKKYGITLAEYTVMKEEREHKCDICGCHEDTLTKSLHVDHCHDTNEIRGLLCHACNTGIGSLKDDPILLQKAMEYLRCV